VMARSKKHSTPPRFHLDAHLGNCRWTDFREVSNLFQHALFLGEDFRA